jgi:oligopeptide transport system substrate-binding protein
MENMVIIPLYEKSNAIMVKSYVSGIEHHSVALNRVYKNTVVE